MGLEVFQLRPTEHVCKSSRCQLSLTTFRLVQTCLVYVVYGKINVGTLLFLYSGQASLIPSSHPVFFLSSSPIPPSSFTPHTLTLLPLTVIPSYLKVLISCCSTRR